MVRCPTISLGVKHRSRQNDERRSTTALANQELRRISNSVRQREARAFDATVHVKQGSGKCDYHLWPKAMLL